jgi:hypothetical protein
MPIQIEDIPNMLEHPMSSSKERIAIFISNVSGPFRMLPGPLKLQGGKPGRETVHDELHHPRSATLSPPRSLCEFAVVLAAMR